MASKLSMFAPLGNICVVANYSDRVATLPTPSPVRILFGCDEESTPVDFAANPTVEPSHSGRAEEMLSNAPVFIFNICHGFPTPKRENLSLVV